MLPHASATGNIHIGTIAGKLNGVMPAHTPTGWRSDQLSTSVPTFSLNSPLSRCGMPVANSTTSMPRVIEPSASASVLPCSSVTIARERLLVRLHELAKAHQDRARGAARGDARQPGSAAVAARTAASTSVGIGERHVADHFAGRRIGDFAVALGLRAATARPPIHSGSRSSVVRSMCVSSRRQPCAHATASASASRAT